jgi:hypothetical protein
MLALIAALAIALGWLVAPLMSELATFAAGAAIFVAACFTVDCQWLPATIGAGLSYFVAISCQVMGELLSLPELVDSMRVAPWAPLATLRHLLAPHWLLRFAVPLAAALATHLLCQWIKQRRVAQPAGTDTTSRG